MNATSAVYHEAHQGKWRGKRFVVMAGGTGGHVYPALALAQALREQGADITWLGNAKGFEYAKVTAAGFDFCSIEVRGLRGRGWKDTLTAPFMLAKALWQTRNHFRRLKPDAVVGFGGFVSGPGGLVARWLGIPLFIHEQNAIFGLTNRVLSYFAKRVMLGYAIDSVDLKHGIVTGNPVRQDIQNLPEPAKRFMERDGAVRLLVLGGSQGAQALNRVLPQALALLSPQERPEVLHQIGAGNSLEEVQSAYAQAGVTAQVVPYIENMAEAYGQADWVLARSGALTVAEIATVGIGAVFVPFPTAVDDHQTANAQTLANVGAAEVIAQSALSAERLAEAIKARQTRANLLAQAQAARALSQAQALAKIMETMQVALHS
ncbi:MAG: undecaprenyldiphospho-muramoylpentapeptide beta-N-acetylglucosaminyltransferase [Cardiobacteriaceae bacterium]|nr:undecaprenyldiphospho-muramoylpentapeptide beta-N-acetylglucosaminyltransferase [Cardiobacteriaceae bacterium]